MSMYDNDILIRYIRTKNKTRKIVTYRSIDCRLRIYHKRVNSFLEERFIPPIFAKGYIKGRSIYHNALSHMYNDCFIMLDVKDFFLRICHKQLSDKLFREINLTLPDQISKKECNDIVRNCSIGNRGIPLGFITSPLLSNIYLKEFDNIFYGKLKKLQLSNIIYTRYADDITVSFKCDAVNKTEAVVQEIVGLASALLARYGLQLNMKKTRSYNLNISNHVKVTGVNIIKHASGERKLTVGRSIKNQLFWEAINCMRDNKNDVDQIQHIKGVQSFVLSIEKQGYEGCYSETMMQQVHELGYSTLKELIDSL